MLTCPSRAVLHMDCPGCGLQRSFIALLGGHFKESVRFHPATAPLLFLLVYAGLHLIFKFRNGGKIILCTQLIAGILTAGFYVYKIINHQVIH